MKKIFFLLLLVSCAFNIKAQQNTPRPGDIIKADLKNTLEKIDYSGLFMQTAAVTPSQKPAVNKIFADYMSARKALFLSTRNNPVVYQQQQPALFNTFKTNLSTVLSTQQLNAFMATKPTPGDKENFLIGVFY